MTIHESIGADLRSFGGYLRCEECGARCDLGDVGERLANGWPKHCGYTMRWWTARQVAAGEDTAARLSIPVPRKDAERRWFRKRGVTRLEMRALSLDEANMQYEIALQTIVGTGQPLAHNCNGCATCIAHAVLVKYCRDYDPSNPMPWIERAEARGD